MADSTPTDGPDLSSLVEDTFAEAFPMTAARAIITAETPGWAETAARVMTGYATSVIACDAEAGLERAWSPAETPDGRPGVGVLVFAFNFPVQFQGRSTKGFGNLHLVRSLSSSPNPPVILERARRETTPCPASSST
jgi:hypothetical protein